MSKLSHYYRIKKQKKQKKQLVDSSGMSKPTSIDVLLQRLANGSQLALVLLALFGYFYTVLPVYQKALLDEDIAKKTLELRDMNDRIQNAEILLKSKEMEVTAMLKQINELKETADTTRQNLSRALAEATAARRNQDRAEAEAGLLRETFELTYQQLLPRLLREFQSLSISKCKVLSNSDDRFTDCVEHQVLTSPSLNAFEQADKNRLVETLRQKSAQIETSLADFTSQSLMKRQKIDEQVKAAQSHCEQIKNVEDYKDQMKKISIDYQCNRELIDASSQLNKLDFEELFSRDKLLASLMSEVVKDFYKK